MKKIIIILEGMLLSLLFYGILKYCILKIDNDISLHSSYILDINIGDKGYTPNFLYYYLVNFISGFTMDYSKILNVSVVVLSFSLLLKYFLAKKYIFNTYLSSTFSRVILALSIMLVFCIPDYFSYFLYNRMYLGKWVGNVWHNSTIIFLFPFSILLFKHQVQSFINPVNNKLIVILTSLVLINLFIKPSFFLVYFPVTFIFLMFRRSKDTCLKEYLLRFIPLFIGGLVLVIQKYLIYNKEIGSLFEEHSSLVFFEGYKVYEYFFPLKYLLVTIFSSFLFPILFLFFNKNFLKNVEVLYIIILLLFGLLLSFTVSESGPRMYHGNFLWQNIVTTFILFMVLFKYALKLNNKKILIIYFLHVLSGILYLFHIVIDKTFY